MTDPPHTIDLLESVGDGNKNGEIEPPKSGVRRRVLCLLAIAIVVLLAAFSGTMAWLYRQENDVEIKRTLRKTEEFYNLAMHETTVSMITALEAIARDEVLIAALKNQDRAAIAEQGKDLYEELRKSDDITHFYFVAPDRTCIYRQHMPDRWGDTIDRTTMLRAQKEDAMVSGIEVGPYGTLTLRTVRPCYDSGELVGFIELGKEIDHFTKSLQTVFNVDVWIVVRKEFLVQDRWQEYQKNAGRMADWDQFPKTVLTSYTRADIPEPIVQAIAADVGYRDKAGDFFAYADGYLEAAYLPISDAKGRMVATAVLARDVSNIAALRQRGARLVALTCVLVGAAMFLACYLILGKIERMLRRTYGSLIAESRARIAEERQYAEAIERARQNVIDGIAAPIAVVSPDRRIVLANRALKEAVGEVNNPIIGDICRDLLGPRLCLCKENQCVIEKAFQTATEVHVNLPPIEKDGHERVFDMLGSPVRNAEGDLAYVVISFHDVTDRYETTKALQLEKMRLQKIAADLKQANEDIRQFAYIASHDLRAPLVNLQGFTSELGYSLDTFAPILEAALPHLREEQAKTAALLMRENIPDCLRFINAATAKMGHLVSALLRLSFLGRRKLRFETLDMNALVAQILQDLAPHLKAANAHVSVESLPEMVADRTAMKEIMVNLMANAVKYLEPGRPGKIEIIGKRNETTTTLSVRDNGCGIAEENMSKVFMPFRQAGKHNIPGEGLGMAYVYALVRRHRGDIRCESELGVGTAFTFDLPNNPAVSDRLAEQA